MENEINTLSNKIISDDIQLSPPPESLSNIYNINVGILGHVDSGKTSLSKILSSISSTASFDKNPQSKERGITLDLGFSAFYIETPKKFKNDDNNNIKLKNSNYIQFTLVDCPGHASLIKTIISGANIIDTFILVIDAVKGVQVQTVECLILGEILCDDITVVMNKIDLIKDENYEKKAEKLKSGLRNKTKFKNLEVIPFSCLNINNENNNNIDKNIQIKKIIANILNTINFNNDNNNINNNKDFMAYIDHSFKIKNKGTIITGTVINGSIKINDEIYFPELSDKKTIKEIQIFKKNVNEANKGDRVGILLKNYDNNIKIERSIICNPNNKNILYSEGGIFLIKKIRLYKNDLISNNKYYLMIGNQGVNAKILFFNNNNNNIDIKDIKNLNANEILKNFYDIEYNYVDNINIDDNNNFYYAFIKFDKKIIIPLNMIFLGSKIDIDISEKKDRLAFYGKIIDNYNNNNNIYNKLKIFKNKFKEGKILRIDNNNENIIIAKGLFKKENNFLIKDYIGKEVYIKEDKDKKYIGKILSSFGQSGKIKIEFNIKLNDNNIKLKNEIGEEILDYKNYTIIMEYKKYIKLDKI